MRLSRAWLVIGLLIASVPAASANAPVVANEFSAEGNATIEGAAVALFLDVSERGLLWSAEAAEVSVYRTVGSYQSVHPYDDRPNAYSNYANRDRETTEYGPATLTSITSRMPGALLALAYGDTELRGSTSGLLRIQNEEAPTFASYGAQELRGGNSAATEYAIWERLPGTYLNLTASDGVYELRGNFELHLVDIDYELRSASGTVTGETGRHSAQDLLLASAGTVEKHIITLHDATLRLTVPGEASVYTESARLDYDGSLRAAGEDTPLETRTALDLSPEGGQVRAMGTPAALAETGAVLPDAPRLPWWLLAGILALTLASLAAFALARRRARTDDLEAAVLAMEERRWNDALPHLERVLARRPADANILVDHALCLEQAGRLPRARIAYERALSEAPDNADAHLYYARTLARLRDTATARTHLQRALALDPRLREIALTEPLFLSM